MRIEDTDQERSVPGATEDILKTLHWAGIHPDEGVMLKGTMDVLHDSKTKEMIWNDGDEMYYPQGVTDPDYCVLKFTAENGRHYSNFKSENFTVE